MFDKIKDLGAQVQGKAIDAVEGVSTSVKGGVASVTNAATNVTEKLNEKAVRASTAQMCNILEIAIDEIRTRPVSAQPVALTATVNFGIATLEMQVQLNPDNHEQSIGAIAARDSGD
jgi:hypothetical protein